VVRTNQGGSVLGFIVIGVAMALLLVGGVYLVRQQINTPSSQGPAQTPQPPKPQPEKPQPTKPNQGTVTPDQTTAPTALPQTPPPSPSSELPKTGPAETVSVLAALLLLTLAGVSYVRSRRLLRSSL